MDSEKYFENYIGKCMLSCIENKRNGNVYIIDSEIPLGVNLYQEKLARVAFAPADQVFAVDFGPDGMYRAVLDDGKTETTAFLLDIGETIDVMTPNVKGIYYISDKAQNIEPQCIPCQLKHIVDKGGFELDIEEYLESWLYEPVHFLVERRNRESDLLEISLHADKSTIAKYVAKNLERVQITEEQRRILFEEENGTSNALKAVLGYEPQDSKRICPHFDPITGGCFKGKTCRLEHVAPLEDGWTRDQRDANMKLLPQVLPRINSVVEAIVTCADSIDDFFVYLPEKAAAYGITLESLKKSINTKEMIKQYRQMKVLPEDLELIVFKHKGSFYRGRTEGVDSQGVVVTFIDYGYMATINPANVYEWHPRWNTIPALAYQCIMNKITMRDENDQDAIDIFRELVFGRKILKAKVIDNVDCLTVELIDRDGMSIGDILYSMNVVKQKQKLIPDRNRAFAPA